MFRVPDEPPHALLGVRMAQAAGAATGGVDLVAGIAAFRQARPDRLRHRRQPMEYADQDDPFVVVPIECVDELIAAIRSAAAP